MCVLSRSLSLSVFRSLSLSCLNTVRGVWKEEVGPRHDGMKYRRINKGAPSGRGVIIYVKKKKKTESKNFHCFNMELKKTVPKTSGQIELQGQEVPE